MVKFHLNSTQWFLALHSGGFRGIEQSTRTELEYKHKVPNLHVSPPDANAMLPAVFCLFALQIV